MGALNHFSDILLTRLVWTSIQAGLLIGAVYLAGRLWPRLSAAMRCMLWWLVGAQLLLGLLWHAPLELPLLSPAPLEIAVAQVAPSAAVLTAATASDATLSPIATPATPRSRSRSLSIIRRARYSRVARFDSTSSRCSRVRSARKHG